MMPDEFRSGHAKVRQDESGKVRRVSKRPYVRPRIARQDLEHAVLGTISGTSDLAGGRGDQP